MNIIEALGVPDDLEGLVELALLGLAGFILFALFVNWAIQVMI